MFIGKFLAKDNEGDFKSTVLKIGASVGSFPFYDFMGFAFWAEDFIYIFSLFRFFFSLFITLFLERDCFPLQLLSLPRDTYTEIVGTGGYDKLNHAYAYGKAPMVINSVEKLLDTTIDFYVQINMEGLMEFVDAVGGIEVTSPLTFTYEERSFVQGKTETLDGESALRFARMRYDDPEGDYGSVDRKSVV